MTVDIDLSLLNTPFRLKRRVELYLGDLILLGCVADPFIYAARMRQVRSGYARIWNGLVGWVARRVVQEPQTRTVQGRVRGSDNETRSPRVDSWWLRVDIGGP